MTAEKISNVLFVLAGAALLAQVGWIYLTLQVTKGPASFKAHMTCVPFYLAVALAVAGVMVR